MLSNLVKISLQTTIYGMAAPRRVITLYLAVITETRSVDSQRVTQAKDHPKTA